jgi:outer membrane protein assembly factor BamB
MIKNSILTIAVLSLGVSALAEDWTNWRGPNYNGATTAENLPVKFSKTENVAWQIELPGPGAGTPIIVGDRMFLSSARIENAASGKGQLLALCLDRKTGKTLWERNAGSGYRPNGDGADYRLDNRGTYASPSPVTDGETVVFFYGNGDLVGFNMKGDKLWARNIQKGLRRLHLPVDFLRHAPHSMRTSFTCPCSSATNPCTAAARRTTPPSSSLWNPRPARPSGNTCDPAKPTRNPLNPLAPSSRTTANY